MRTLPIKCNFNLIVILYSPKEKVVDTSEADKTNIDVHITETIWKLTRSQEKVNHWLTMQVVYFYSFSKPNLNYARKTAQELLIVPKM